MKPQMEGGGANLYGDEMCHALRTMNDEQLSAHILMQRIHPSRNTVCLGRGQRRIHSRVQNYLLRADNSTQSQPVQTISELGVYGYLLGDMCCGLIMVSQVQNLSKPLYVLFMHASKSIFFRRTYARTVICYALKMRTRTKAA
jgi:hypothetical protein